MQRFALTVCVLLCSSCFSHAGKYDGYQLLGVTPSTTNHARELQDILQAAKFDVWSEVYRAGSQVTFLVPPVKLSAVKQYLAHALDTTVEVIREDVGRDIREENERLTSQRQEALANQQLAFNISDFNTYEDMMAQLELFVDQCPTGFTCTTAVAGQSSEGRDQKYLKISADPDDDTRPGIWIDSLIHAREWITGTTSMNMIDNLLSSYGSDDTVTRLMDTYDWYFLPVVNPDGYQYTWDTERLWRKSRNINPDSDCIGTDLNRNFDHQWMNAGTSPDPCSDIFAGSGPGSEPETQTLQDQALTLGPRLLAWISMHSAADMWLHPFGSVDEQDDCEVSPDYDAQFQAGEAAALATMATDNTVWTYGSICETIYPAAGTTCDYTYAKGGIKYSYTPELRGNGYGFIIPPDQIPIAYQEIWNGLVALIEEAEIIEGGRP